VNTFKAVPLSLLVSTQEGPSFPLFFLLPPSFFYALGKPVAIRPDSPGRPPPFSLFPPFLVRSLKIPIMLRCLRFRYFLDLHDPQFVIEGDVPGRFELVSLPLFFRSASPSSRSRSSPLPFPASPPTNDSLVIVAVPVGIASYFWTAIPAVHVGIPPPYSVFSFPFIFFLPGFAILVRSVPPCRIAFPKILLNPLCSFKVN